MQDTIDNCGKEVQHPNPKVFKALRNQLAAVLNELCRIENSAGIDAELLETIRMITVIMNGMQSEA